MKYIVFRNQNKRQVAGVFDTADEAWAYIRKAWECGMSWGMNDLFYTVEPVVNETEADLKPRDPTWADEQSTADVGVRPRVEG